MCCSLVEWFLYSVNLVFLLAGAGIVGGSVSVQPGCLQGIARRSSAGRQRR